MNKLIICTLVVLSALSFSSCSNTVAFPWWVFQDRPSGQDSGSDVLSEFDPRSFIGNGLLTAMEGDDGSATITAWEAVVSTFSARSVSQGDYRCVVHFLNYNHNGFTVNGDISYVLTVESTGKISSYTVPENSDAVSVSNGGASEEYIFNVPEPTTASATITSSEGIPSFSDVSVSEPMVGSGSTVTIVGGETIDFDDIGDDVIISGSYSDMPGDLFSLMLVIGRMNSIVSEVAPANGQYGIRIPLNGDSSAGYVVYDENNSPVEVFICESMTLNIGGETGTVVSMSGSLHMEYNGSAPMLEFDNFIISYKDLYTGETVTSEKINGIMDMRAAASGQDFNDVVIDVAIGGHDYSDASNYMAMMAINTLSTQIANYESQIICNNDGTFQEKDPSSMYTLSGTYSVSDNIRTFAGSLEVSGSIYSFEIEVSDSTETTYADIISFTFEGEVFPDEAVRDLNKMNSWA